MLNNELLIITRTLKYPSCLSTNEWIKKMLLNKAQKGTIKKNEITK